MGAEAADEEPGEVALGAVGHLGELHVPVAGPCSVHLEQLQAPGPRRLMLARLLQRRLDAQRHLDRRRLERVPDAFLEQVQLQSQPRHQLARMLPVRSVPLASRARKASGRGGGRLTRSIKASRARVSWRSGRVQKSAAVISPIRLPFMSSHCDEASVCSTLGVLALQGLALGLGALGCEDHLRQGGPLAAAPSPACGLPARVAVGVDELGLDRPAVAAHEDELVAFRKAPLDDGRRQRRDQYWSMARFRGRAPISAEKPFSSRNSCAEASHSTAQSRSFRPRRSSTRLSSFFQDLAHQVARQRAEHDHLVEPVLELGRKVWPIARMIWSAGKRRRRRKAEPRGLMAGRAEIGRQDDHAVAEVGDVPQRVGQPPVVEHLQEQVQTGVCAFSNSSSSTTEAACAHG